MGHVLINNTRGKEDVERVSLAFLVGNVARNSDQQATVLLTVDGVWMATKGYADELPPANGFAPLRELIGQFVASGGQLWVCGACAKPRGIAQELLIDGAQIVGAATAVEALVNGAQSLSF